MRELKRIDLSKLSPELAEKITTLLLREQASKIVEVTPEEIEKATQFLDIPSKQGYYAFCKLLRKWLEESAHVKGKFKRYLNELAPVKQQVKYPKPRKVRKNAKKV
jgi:hypothetical protein